MPGRPRAASSRSSRTRASIPGSREGPNNWNDGAWLSAGLVATVLVTFLQMVNAALSAVERLLILVGPICLAAYALPATQRITNGWLKVLLAILLVRFAWTIVFVLFSLEALGHIGPDGNPPTVGDTQRAARPGDRLRAAHVPAAVRPHPGRPVGAGTAADRDVNERGLVEVPENAVRDEPIAFGLTGVQLGICALAVLVAAVLNLLPIWEPIRLVLVVLGAGPIAIAAALPVRGEPAYRWIVRAVRHRRGPRSGRRTCGAPDKPQLSGLDDTGTIRVSYPPMSEPPVPQAAEEREAPPAIPAAPLARTPSARRRFGTTRSGVRAADPRPAPARPAARRLPHVVRRRGRQDDARRRGRVARRLARQVPDARRARSARVRVLLLDAARTNPAAHLRLGLDPATVSKLLTRYDWPDAMTFEKRAVETRFGVTLLSLPQLPLQGLGPELPFESDRGRRRSSTRPSRPASSSSWSTSGRSSRTATATSSARPMSSSAS